MLNDYLNALQNSQTKLAARNELADALEALPLEELEALARGETKLAYCGLKAVGGECGETASWLEQFKGTPLFDEAFALEQAAIELDMGQAQRRMEESAQWAKQDMMRAKRRQLELQLQAGGEAPAAPAAPPAAAAPAPEAPPAPTEEKTAGTVTKLPGNLSRLGKELGRKASVVGKGALETGVPAAVASAATGAGVAALVDGARARSQARHAKDKTAGIVIPFPGARAAGEVGKKVVQRAAKDDKTLKTVGRLGGTALGIGGGALLGVKGQRAFDDAIERNESRRKHAAPMHPFDAADYFHGNVEDAADRATRSPSPEELAELVRYARSGAEKSTQDDRADAGYAAQHPIRSMLRSAVPFGAMGGLGGAAMGSLLSMGNPKGVAIGGGLGLLAGGALGAYGRSPGVLASRADESENALAGLQDHLLSSRIQDELTTRNQDEDDYRERGQMHYQEGLKGDRQRGVAQFKHDLKQPKTASEVTELDKKAFWGALAGAASKGLPGAGAAIAKGGLRAGKLLNQAAPGLAAQGMGSGIARAAQGLGQAVTHGGLAGGAKNLARGAVGFAKANPLAAAGIAGGAGLVGGALAHKAMD